MGRMWIFYEHSQGPDCWYSIGGRLMGRFLSISSGGKKKKESSAAKYIGLPGSVSFVNDDEDDDENVFNYCGQD